MNLLCSSLTAMMVSSLPRSPPRAIVILLSLVPGLLAELNQCYLPNGTDINSIDGEFQYNYVPCMKYEGVQSMCCSAWDHLCTTNGLCYSTLQNLYYRDACTDPTWQDPACTKLFMDGTAGDTTVSLTPCYDGSYCLWANTTGADCCQAGNGVFIGDDGNPTKVKPTKARSNIGLPTFTVTSTVTHTAASVTSQAETNGTSSRSSLSSADKAGIGVGVTLGVLIILGLVAVILFMRRKLSQAYSELGSKEDHRLITGCSSRLFT